jgi:hypothetical protein
MYDLETSAGALVTNDSDNRQVLGRCVLSRRTDNEAERSASLCQCESTCSTDSCMGTLVNVCDDNERRTNTASCACDENVLAFE